MIINKLLHHVYISCTFIYILFFIYIYFIYLFCIYFIYISFDNINTLLVFVRKIIVKITRKLVITCRRLFIKRRLKQLGLIVP